MRVRITPGAALSGEARVPGDKSIAHRWLILAGTARGSSRLAGLPLSLDVRSTAACIAAVNPKARGPLDLWSRRARAVLEGGRSTWNATGSEDADPVVEVEGQGGGALVTPGGPLECGNSGTTMRLLTGMLAGTAVRATLTGDASLSARPMGRVASPLRAMGAQIETVDGHAPLTVVGCPLVGIRFEAPVPSAQVKSAVLRAGLSAQGETTVVEPAPTRDHTERALLALGAPITVGHEITVGPYQHEGFAGRVPGDPSSAAFLVAAAALTGSEIVLRDVGLNPTRLHYLDVMATMGIEVRLTIEREEMGEPVGSMWVRPPQGLSPVRVEPADLPLVIDEVPVLAALAAHAPGESWFLGAGELRVKESDRLTAIAEGIRSLGGHASDEGDDLVVVGLGLRGGTAGAGGDHRMAMSFAVGALAADGPCVVDGAEAADVSFPGFWVSLAALGATVEEAR
jgi:3-phosphoshikimate 1-carboxyvinyltransferase